MSYRSINPATGEVLKTFTEHTDNQVMDALSAADSAFRDWAEQPFSERSKIMGRSAQILRAQKKELARLATLEMGKRIAESRGEVELAASIMQYFADNAEAFLAPKKLNSVMGHAHLEYSPLGVLLSIQPWNYPYYPLARLRRPISWLAIRCLLNTPRDFPNVRWPLRQSFRKPAYPMVSTRICF